MGDRVRVPGGRVGTVTASEGWAVFVEVDGAGEEAFREDQLAPVAAVAALGLRDGGGSPAPLELGVPIGHRARIIKEHKALHPELW